jgi:hypothetical protein
MHMLEFVCDFISCNESRVVGFDRYQTVFDANGEAFCSIKHDLSHIANGGFISPIR